jgi:predicted unusual protein kinase regulating ubiquinone biosynthesis (AarF/ABC1/UbiB family)
MRLTLRYLRVLLFFGGMAIKVVWWELLLRRIGFRRLARRTAPGRYRKAAAQFRRLAIRLGGIWIKVGQFLSARVDILPRGITDELAGLQDEVPEEDFSAIMALVQSEFGRRPDEVFPRLDSKPLASASLGQVHRAHLVDGTEVVVKIQRPGITALIEIDLRALRVVIGWLRLFAAVRRRIDLDALFTEFSRTVWEEVDYLAEAENAKRFQMMFADDEQVRIPRVYDDQTTRRVLTLEDVYFIKITDYQAIEDAGIDRAQVAERLFKTYLHQIFEIGFFHADPHPGNLFVEPGDDGSWRLIFVDFGMVGQLKPEAKAGMRELAIAVGTKDSHRLVSAYEKLNMLLPGADLNRIEQAEAMMFERFWGLSMGELRELDPKEMRQIGHQYRDLLYELPFQAPTDLIFLGRCIGILSGMCTGLDPDFNLFAGLMPFARSLLGDEGDLVDEVLGWLEGQLRTLLAVPGKIESTINKIERGELVVTAKPSPELDRNFKDLTRAVNRLAAAVIFFAFATLGTVLFIGGETSYAGGMATLAALVLFWIFLRS